MVMQQKIAVPTGQLTSGDGATTVIHLAEAGPVRIPNGNFLVTAQFERVGDDLMLTGRDGAQVLVVDYFASSAPPTLVSELGAEIPGELAGRLAGPASAGAYAQAGGATGRPTIGAVEALTGDATATRTDGSKVPLAIGAPVFQGDVVETTPGSRLAIVFNDKTTFTLDSATRMVLDELVYNPGGDSRSAFSLVQGTFVYISGEIAKAAPQNVQIRTPVATVGIRGTEVGFVILGPGDTGGASITVLDGEIAVRNTGGSQILSAGFAVNVSSTFTPPSTPVATPLANIMSQYGALRGYGANAITNSINRSQREQQQLQLQAPPAPGHGGGPVTGGMRAASGQAGSISNETSQAAPADQTPAALAGIAPAAGQIVDGVVTTTAPSTFGPSMMIAGMFGFAAAGPIISLTSFTPTAPVTTGTGSRAATDGGDHRVVSETTATPPAPPPSGEVIAVPDQSNSTAGAGPVVIDVLANDQAPPDDTVTVVAIDTTNTQGTVTIAPDGTQLDYSPGNAFQSLGAGQTATDTFTYTIEDAAGVQSTATVTVTVVGVNDAPVAVNDAVSAPASNTVEILALANDTDPDIGDSKTIVAISNTAANGTVAITGGGTSLSYTPNIGLQGLGAGQTVTDTFTYTMADSAGAQSTATVTVTITGVNDAPTAVDDTVSLTAGGSTVIAALANDTDPDAGDTKTIIAVDVGGTLGSASIVGGGTGLSYATGAAFANLGAGQTAIDTFTYTMRDAAGVQSTATVRVTVTGVNDAPTDIALSGSLVAENAAIGTLVGTLAATDSDAGDTVTFSLFNDAGGAFVLDGNTIRVAGPIDFEASPTRQITVRATDAAGAFYDETVTITVQNVNEAPVITSNGGGGSGAIAVLEGTTAVTTVTATDPDAGTTFTFAIVGGADASRFVIDSATGQLSFASPPIFEAPTDADGNGIYDVTVQASDGSLTDTQSIAVTVNDNPNADPNDFDHLGLPGPQNLSGAGASNDVLYGGAGNDTINGQTGQDTIYGGSGDDTITAGGNDPDLIFGGSGNDQIQAGESGDTLVGGIGNDTLQGGQGNDVVEGGAGNDSLIGGQGNDQIVGGPGVDNLTGGQGADKFVFNSLADGTTIATNQTIAASGLAVDDIMDFSGGVDKLVFDSSVFSPTAPVITIGGAYDGTNSGVASGPVFVHDSSGVLSYDPDVATEGYTAVAEVGNAAPQASDLQFTPPSG